MIKRFWRIAKPEKPIYIESGFIIKTCFQHSCIIKCLQTIDVSKNINTFIETSMKQWEIELMVRNGKYGFASIRRGLFRGGSLSPYYLSLLWYNFQLFWRKQISAIKLQKMPIKFHICFIWMIGRFMEIQKLKSNHWQTF